MTDATHADRRHPEQPAGAFDLADACQELLRSARELDAGRAARTLTPGEGIGLKQTLLAIRGGRKLDEHRTNGRATVQVLQGAVRVTSGSEELALHDGQWAVVPAEEHEVHADKDAVILLTVAG